MFTQLWNILFRFWFVSYSFYPRLLNKLRLFLSNDAYPCFAFLYALHSFYVPQCRIRVIIENILTSQSSKLQATSFKRNNIFFPFPALGCRSHSSSCSNEKEMTKGCLFPARLCYDKSGATATLLHDECEFVNGSIIFCLHIVSLALIV